MSNRATSSFDIIAWDETPYDDPSDGPQLARATVRKTFRGDLKGQSTAELLMCQADTDNFSAGAGYVASEQFSGRLGERKGTFVLQHGGLSDGEDGERTFGHVVPGSGTGELAGLRGEAEISRTPDGTHTLTLEYSLKEA